MLEGKVIRWIEDKGFGFVREDGPPERSIFTHISDIELGPYGELPYAGDRVTFTLIDTDRGLRATAVKITHRARSFAP
jgi:cold shock protein